jgi:hypothetical protein
MAETESAATAATNPTTEVAKSESVDIKSSQNETNDKSENAGELEGKRNGKSEGKHERHEERRSGRNDRNNDRNGDRRGSTRGRGRGGFQHQNKKCASSPLDVDVATNSRV